ncbi:MAG: prepilin-type N-terminal cleavage/methylation domain-containing protein [Desulfobacterales bacterium]|nr:prepilin-type N-terminal cleavage/methylation domain-containing protein [Desulfobacterales bacterium]
MSRENNQMNQDGFTLIEVMITLFVLTFTIGGMATFNITMAKYNQTATDSTTVSLIAQQKLEALINIGYESLDSGSFGPEAYISKNNKSFDVEWNVSASGTHKEINVTVFYRPTGQKKIRNIKLKTTLSS